MHFIRQFIRYCSPSVEPRVRKEMDRWSLRNIHVISLIVLFFESVSFLFFIASRVNRFDNNDFVSTLYVCFCIALCAGAAYLSRKMYAVHDLPHKYFFLFKIGFFILFSLWAVLVDYRHYVAGDQMLSYFTVSLLMVCFVLFRPWIGTLLIGASFGGLYLVLYFHDGAAAVHPLNYLMFAIASIVSNAILYHAQINVSAKKISLIESNEALAEASRRDGLTGLLNRLALEEDAQAADGRRMTAYMVDVNYFKEINDRCGHAAGDAILREVSETLKRLYPGGYYYRYGGDEFLVLTHKAPEDNFGSDIYDFTCEGEKVILSIGNAQGCPADYQEIFALISAADKALYVTKQRTHSAEFGGHDRRKARS